MYLTPEELERKFYIENNSLYYQLVNLIDPQEEQYELGYSEGKSNGYDEGYAEGYEEALK